MEEIVGDYLDKYTLTAAYNSCLHGEAGRRSKQTASTEMRELKR